MGVVTAEMGEVPTWATPEPRPAPFGSGQVDTMSKLEYEISYLYGTEIVVYVTGSRVEIRRDGWPSARSKLSPPVIVSFTSEHGDMSFRSGSYDHWVGNVHAVALTLERLRAIDRYGCVASGEQYQGFKALPAQSIAADCDPVDVLASILGERPSIVGTSSPEKLKIMYRQALRAVHPDTRTGGSVFNVDDVNRAYKALTG